MGELKSLVAKLILGLFLGGGGGGFEWGGGVCQRDGVAIAPRDSGDEAMKEMLMKAMKSATR